MKVPQDTRRDVTSIIGCAVLTGSGAVYNTAGVREGDSVAIFGVGGVGLSAVVAASVVNANPIIAVDLDDEKLEFAKKFGATHGVNAGGGDAIEQIKELTGGPAGITTSFGEAHLRRRFRLRLHRPRGHDGPDPARRAAGRAGR